MIRLETATASLDLLPDEGGGVSRYDVIVDGIALPIFQTAPDPTRTGPFRLGCNVLAPWANRISGGGFTQDGHFHALAPNIAGEPYPNHGNGFALPWHVAEATATRATLGLAADGPGPFRYAARLVYGLAGSTLTATLTLTNRATIALPFGGGFHPWFVRTPVTRLTLRADGVWTERADHLPERWEPLARHPEWDFSAGRALPADWINAAFTGWNGRARIDWPEMGLAVEITARAPLGTAMVYSPSAAADYVSVEPVSHTVDAHNMDGPHVARPQVLAPGDTLTLAMTLRPTA